MFENEELVFEDGVDEDTNKYEFSLVLNGGHKRHASK